MTAAIAGNAGGWFSSTSPPNLDRDYRHQLIPIAGAMLYIEGMYRAITRNIAITVKPHFLESQSEPQDSKFVWAYTITIENHGTETVKLLTRHWVITDGNGHKQEITGPGVVGEYPTLRPQDSYQYSSGCPLPTPSGLMLGSYGMVTDRGEHFDVAIPAFSLDSHFDKHTVN